MAAPHTHTKQIHAWASEYLDEVKNSVLPPLDSLKTSPGFREIYQISLAFDAVLIELGKASFKPTVESHRSIVLRVPLLVAIGQSSAATIEMRRLTELVFWTIYFKDHAIEWAHFLANPSDGYHPSVEQPIRYCAHRGSKFYIDYADERFGAEPSGLAKDSISQMRSVVSILNATVHPAHLAIGGSQAPPVESVSEISLKVVAKVWREISSNLAILLSSIYCDEFDHLQPVHRGHFNWLIGRERSKKLLSGPFGLA
jgi:hypothetical protein